VKNHTDFKNNY